jgi:hypothetical protein
MTLQVPVQLASLPEWMRLAANAINANAKTVSTSTVTRAKGMFLYGG